MKDIIMAKKIANKVLEHGGQTYFVGGYVRDKILGIENKDIDIEVHNIIPKVLKSILLELGEIKTQGSSFGVYNLKGYNIDIAQPRMESSNGRGHKDFEIYVDPFIGVENAAKRRDFTINALMENVITGEIIDNFNGLDDLHNGIIRHINDNTFIEDPLRVLRAAQFAARFEFTIAPETLKLMEKMDLFTLSNERIYGEMKKALLKAKKPSIFFNILRNTNQLNVWFKELVPLINCPQNPIHHPEGDVWNHTMNVIDCASNYKKDVTNPEYFMVSALCHDFGKPNALSIDDNGIPHSYNHEYIGIPVVEAFLSRLNSDNSLRKYVINMVQNHMNLHNTFYGKSKIRKTNEKFDISICPNDLIYLTISDSASKGIDNIEETNWIFERYSIYKELMQQPQVTGKDLIDLGIKPGPIFTEILNDAHKQHLCGVDKVSILKGIEKKLYKNML